MSRIPQQNRGKQAERTRSALLEAARDVFLEQGFSAARVDDITRRAGTSHGAFYIYFQGKRGAFDALAEQASRELDELGAAMDAWDWATDITPWIRRFIDTHNRHAPVFASWILGRLEPSGRESLDDLTSRVRRALERTGAPVGDPGAAAAGLIAMLFAIARLTLPGPAELDPATAAQTAAALWRGIARVSA